MHDLKYAQQILEVLKKEVTDKDKSAAIIINIKISPLSHVTAKSLNDAFRISSEGENYGNARLNIETSEFSVQCKTCGNKSMHKKAVLKCPKCGGGDFDITECDEFCINSIEIK